MACVCVDLTVHVELMEHVNVELTEHAAVELMEHVNVELTEHAAVDMVTIIINLQDIV